jgi:hypothetical protein
MSVCVYSVCVVLCVGRGLATGLSPVQGVLLTVYRIRNPRMQPRTNKRAVETLIIIIIIIIIIIKLHGLNPRANYTDRATAACRRSDCQLLRIEGATWSA